MVCSFSSQFFSPVVKKKINELLCKKPVCLHLFPTKNSFKLTYKDKKSRQSYLMTCIFSLIINHRQARMALNIENSSLWVGKWKVKAIRKGRRHFSSRKNHFLAAKSVISHQTASAVLLSHLHGTITESVTRKIQTEIVKAILNNH